ncbi:venom carboxylesterase-6-like [Ostrinia nubilalis]|uniref:venom carboxylesterase-6-like n=1 Tax=Ostrinia nubilalis TaxID=29057 RepID=UPI0030825DF4
MVFIHGGAFRAGSGNSLIYGPDFIVQKNVVLVTLNYRLDALGFLKLDTKDVPGNAGLKDQSLALKWVHDNIAVFGGDPELITLAGQSAGSASVTYHMLSPMSKGLFKRAIAMSGVPFCEWAVTYELTKRSFALGKLLGSNTTDPHEMLNFLQSQSAFKIVHKFPIVIPEEIFWNFGLKMTAFQPAPEKDLGHKRFLVESPIETLKRGNVTPVDLLLGHTSLEYLYQLPNINSSLVNYSLMRRLLIPREIILYGSPQLDFDAIADRIYDKYFGQRAIGYGTLYEFLQYFSQETFEYQIRRFLKYLSAVIKKYFYKFFIISERNRYASLGEPYGIVGVSHSDDIEYIFDSRVAKGGFPVGFPVSVTSEIYRLINQTVTLYTNFVKYGNPTPDGSLGAVWPQYDETSKGYMKINSTLSVDNDPDADAVAFWTSIFSDAAKLLKGYCASATMAMLSWRLLYILSTIIYVESTIVRVNEGLLLGAHKTTSTGLGEFYSFKGIPYAEPPVGSLRFKDPIPRKPWTGIREALIHGPICIQFNKLLNIYLPGSENCLFLNVYTPDMTPEKPLPVMFFIHGGAFRSGSGNSLVYGPDFIIDKKVVLVTINYRLDALGFLKLDTKDVPGNAGMKDQNLALKWVHDNIHKFGGDPNEVTLIGESAGSASVTYHMLSPMSKGLFKRAIAMSGVPFCEWAITYKLTERSFALGKLLGSKTTDPDEMLKFLQEQEAYDIINKTPIVIPEENEWQYIGLKMTAFQPASEKDFGQERFLVEPPTETLKRGNVSAVDLLIGYTSLEYLYMLTKLNNSLEKYNNMRQLLVPREILLYGKNDTDPNDLAAKISKQYFGNKAINNETLEEFLYYQSDEIFGYNINRFLKYYLSTKIKTYLYKFYTLSDRNRFSSVGEPLGITGLSHTDDLLYIFDSIIAPGGPVALSSKIFRLINETVTLFTNFAKYGDPTPDDSLGVDWPEYDNDSKGYLIINSTLRVDRAPDADVNEFWTGIYEEGGVELP